MLIDEIGSSCAPETSLPFMWSVSEKLMSLPANITLLVTHNMWMQSLMQYPCTFQLTMHRHKLTEQEIDVTELEPEYFKDKAFF